MSKKFILKSIKYNIRFVKGEDRGKMQKLVHKNAIPVFLMVAKETGNTVT